MFKMHGACDVWHTVGRELCPSTLCARNKSWQDCDSSLRAEAESGKDSPAPGRMSAVKDEPKAVQNPSVAQARCSVAGSARDGSPNSENGSERYRSSG